MKRIGFIYNKIIDKNNIETAIKRAAKGKLNRRTVQRVLADIPGHVDKIHDMLANKTYRPCPVKERIVKEGASQKERKITTISFFPDQIIHWCLILQIQDRIMKSAYSLSCGSTPGRGVHHAKNFVEKWLKNDRKNTKYVAKLDVAQFYPSIPHNQIKIRLRKTFKDNDLLWLTDTIIGHWCSKDKNGEPIGIPIGFLTSQWFANHLLEPVDYFIKQSIGIKYYLRYMDDFVLFSRNKKDLHKSVKSVSGRLASMGLSLKKNWQIFRPDCRSIDFMGFRFARNNTTLRRNLMMRITRRCKNVSRKYSPTAHESSSILSYMGWLKHSDSHGLFNARVKPFINVKQARLAVSVVSLIKNQENEHENCAV